MSRLFRLRSSLSTPISNLSRCFTSELQYSRFSNLPKSSNQHKLKKYEQNHTKNQTEHKEFSALFDEITEITGTGDFSMPTNSSGFASSGETNDINSCTVRVCKNVTELEKEKEKEKTLDSEETQIVYLGVVDVNMVVHKVTEIVRGECGAGMNSMEERLEKLGIEFDVEVVDKVLKRCFKVPHLALRFFHWVNGRNGFCHSTQTYNTMVYITGETKDFALVDELLKEMEKNMCEKDIKTWTILISQCGRRKLIGKVLLMFDEMKKSGIEPDLTAYKELVGSLCNCGNAEVAMEFYKEMSLKDMELDLNSYKQLLKCLALSGNIDTVQFVADDMIKISRIPEHYVYAYVLKSFCISGRIVEALEVIRNLKDKNISIGPGIFETLVKGLCKADRISDALEIVAILKKKNVADMKIYEMLVDGYLRTDNISKAFEVFQSIKDAGHMPAVSTYTELMQKLFRLREFQKACDLYNEMLENELELDCVAMTAMVAGLVQQKCISEAWNVFKSMEEKGIRATPKCYEVFIKELCKISRIDEVANVLKEAQSSKVVIGDDLSGWVMSNMEKTGGKRDVENVMHMLKTYKISMEGGEVSRHEKSLMHIPILDTSFNSMEAKVQESHLLEAPPKKFNPHDLQEICQILSSPKAWRSKVEDLEKCTQQFTSELVVEVMKSSSIHGGAALQFFSWVGKQYGYTHTPEAYNMAVKVAGRGKDFKYMRTLFFEMRRKGCVITSNTWTIMIMQYGRTGLTEYAVKIFKEMKASGCKPNGSTYKSLIISLSAKKGRKVDEAIQMLYEMITAGFIPDKETIETYLECLCEVGNLLEARKCTEYLLKVGFSIPLSKSLYIRALCRAGRLEEALTAINEVNEGRPTLEQYTYGSIIHALLQKDLIEEALAKMESMKQVGIYPTVHVYTSLIVYFCKGKEIDKALEIFKKMKEEHCEPTIVTYSALIRGYMNTGNVADAWNVFHQMKKDGPLPDFKTYSMFISCLCNGGKSEEALQLISEMLNAGIVPSTVNFRNVNYGLNREGRHNLARTVLRQKWDLNYKRKLLAF